MAQRSYALKIGLCFATMRRILLSVLAVLVRMPSRSGCALQHD